MRKLLALVLVAVMIAVAFAGCGDNAANNAATAGNEPAGNESAGNAATNEANTTGNTAGNTTDNAGSGEPALDLKDHGPDPFVASLDAATIQNGNYRTPLWTGEHLQLVIMSIPAGSEMGLMAHTENDQFLHIEGGEAEVQMGDSVDNLTIVQAAPANTAIFVPHGTYHNVINKGNADLKLYVIYVPPKFPYPLNTIQVTQADSDAQAADMVAGGGTLAATTKETAGAGTDFELKNYGPEPFITDIVAAAKRNTNYRTDLWLGTNLQFTLMSVPAGQTIVSERHPDVDQFIRIVDGEAKVEMGPAQDNFTFDKPAPTNSGIFIPAGTWHQITNTGTTELKIYSVY